MGIDILQSNVDTHAPVDDLIFVCIGVALINFSGERERGGGLRLAGLQPVYKGDSLE